MNIGWAAVCGTAEAVPFRFGPTAKVLRFRIGMRRRELCSASKIQGSLHCAADGGTVRCFGRDDVFFDLIYLIYGAKLFLLIYGAKLFLIGKSGPAQADPLRG
jgi:hypothetical protein